MLQKGLIYRLLNPSTPNRRADDRLYKNVAAEVGTARLCWGVCDSAKECMEQNMLLTENVELFILKKRMEEQTEVQRHGGKGCSKEGKDNNGEDCWK